MTEESPQTEPTRRVTRKKVLTWIFHVIVLVVTLIFVGKNLADAVIEFQKHRPQLDPVWLAVGLVSYCVSLAVLGVPMGLVFQNHGEPVTLWQSTRAYLISHVGKYVPGKAMVIVLRCTLLRPQGLSISRITLTSFYETFAAMASGTIIAIVCLLLLPDTSGYAQAVALQPWLLWVMLLSLMMGFVGSVTPMGFRVITKIATKPLSTTFHHDSDRISERTFCWSIVFGLLAWMIMGFSYVAIMRSIDANAMTGQIWLMATASVSLSIVGGFLSMIPGHAFVREAILIQTIAPVMGKLTAVGAALLFRLITLLGEVGMAAVLYWGKKR